MIGDFLAHFPHVWLPCAGLLLFLAVFTAILSRVFKRGQGKLYKNMSRLPLNEGEPS